MIICARMFMNKRFPGGTAMKKEYIDTLGAEGYIPKALLSTIKSKKVHISASFVLSDQIDVMAKSFAISFYKELRRSGFSEDQVAYFSTELLKCLLEKLEAYKIKIQKR
jgi:hypothetical protein